MIRFLRLLLRMATAASDGPFIEVALFGWKTPRPQIVVAVCSIRGMQSVYTFDADDQGRAKAQLHAMSLGRIADLPVRFRKDPTDAEK